MKVRDIAAAVEAFAPLRLQEDWDNSGLCIGSPSDEVHGVLVGFDCTPELIDEAVSCGADMVVTHHPLIFRGLRSVSPDDPVGEAVIKAVRNQVKVYAAHTNADKVLAGVSGAMARRLGLQDIRVLEADAEGCGLGAVGELPRPLSAEEAVALVKERFSLRLVRASHAPEGLIRRVALCGGSGASLIPAAQAAGARLYLCGDISYHSFFTPKDFMVMDIGHFEGEIEIVSILCDVLRKKFPTFAIRTSERLAASNPIHYL